MLIFITGPSGAGKSTLRDHYCKKKRFDVIAALTTRATRKGETEIHRCIRRQQFETLLRKGMLCFVAENFGFMYGYVREEVERKSRTFALIEVDSKTAIEECKKWGAFVVRIIPYLEKVAAKSIKVKRDNIAERMKDLKEQMRPKFIDERREAGEIIFINYYDEKSLSRFCSILDKLASK